VYVLGYLNALGREGWRVIYYTPAVVRTPTAGETLMATWPSGTHVLVREVAGSGGGGGEGVAAPEA
jgi:hypothetical protein